MLLFRLTSQEPVSIHNAEGRRDQLKGSARQNLSRTTCQILNLFCIPGSPFGADGEKGCHGDRRADAPHLRAEPQTPNNRGRLLTVSPYQREDTTKDSGAVNNPVFQLLLYRQAWELDFRRGEDKTGGENNGAIRGLDCT